MKKILLAIFSIILVILVSEYLPRINRDIDEPHVEINENVTYKTYGEKDVKKEINDISYGDIKDIDISKKKMDKIMEYKEYMGGIKRVCDLKAIPRFTDSDIKKLESVFKDSNISYKVHNINKASELELRYLGLNKQSIKKIANKTLSNMIELKEVIGKDVENIKGAITF